MFLFLSPGANEDSVWNKGGKLLSSGGVFHNVLHVSTQRFLWCVLVHGVGSGVNLGGFDLLSCSRPALFLLSLALGNCIC